MSANDQNPLHTGQRPARNSQGKTASPDLLSVIADQVRTQGPVFRLPALRPTFVFSGEKALACLADPQLVERSPSIVPSQVTVATALCDEEVATLSLVNGEEHIRRRASWLSPGMLDKEGILKAVPVISETIDAVLKEWGSQQIFSMNQAARRACWRISSRLVTGTDADDALLADFETFTGLNEYADIGAAKERVSHWLKQNLTQFTHPKSPSTYCVAAQLAQSKHLTDAELINEIRHGLGGTFFIWTPLTELLRQLALDTEESTQARSEIKLLASNFSLRKMAETPVLMRMVTRALQLCSPLPVFFARAKTSFTAEGVNIPADAILIAALHATNQQILSANHSPADAPSAAITFGVGGHACPAADLVPTVLWQFAVRFFSSYQLLLLDAQDIPVQQLQGLFASRGCYVQVLRDSGLSHKTAPAAQPPVTGRVSEKIARPTVNKTDRIAIVGAGITGLTIAHELRKRGFANVTVFEKAASIGGKADTVYIEGRPYNLGAHLCHGNLGVAALAKEVGVALERAPTYELWDIDNNRAIPRTFEHFQQVEKLRQLLAANPDLDHDAGFAPTESWTYSSVLSWLEAHGLRELKEIGPFFTGAGYGFMQDDVPAGYFLKFAQHMTEDGWTPSGGYKHLLEKVSHELDVRCNHEVMNIQRDANEGVIHLATRIHPHGNSDLDPADCNFVFDRLILTGPLEHASQFLDLTAQEQALFPRIKSLDYYTVIATLDIAKPHTPGLYIVPKNTGNSSERGQTTAFERAFEESNVYHFFCYGHAGQSDASILENIKEDARKLGGEITDVHVFRKWAYAPQVSPHDMALGFHQRIDQMQGRLGTYYAGSLLAFELTDHNVLLAKSLAERFFGDAIDTSVEHFASAKTSDYSEQTVQSTQSILEILKHRYEQTPNRTLSTFLDTKGKVTRALTYKELVERATACAISLKNKGVAAGDRVALVYPPDTDEFLVGFFGCLFVQAIAVPVACPDPRKLDIEIPRFAHIVNDCDCRVALTNRLYQTIALVGRTWNTLTNFTSNKKVNWPKLIWLSTDGLSPVAPGKRFAIPTPSADTLAYLQYTSGSTSNPKGVIINHANILHNVKSICEQTHVNSDSVLVGWVPLFHDMGLVGGPLTTLYSGAHMVFFSPMSFLQNPVLWVQAMHQFRATHTESPNFGYEFLLRNLDEKSLRGIDLSCLRYTLFGGEVMRPRTFERMAEKLSGTGFRADTMTNIFGAAEATLYLAGGNVDHPPFLTVDTKALETQRRAMIKSPDLRSTTTLIGCGIPTLECDLRIVNPNTKRLLPDGEVGEVWLSSPSVSQGYWGKSTALNEQTFRARVADDPMPLRTYLRTGDLGFVDQGILYICGRVKEMMIFNGRNIHPMDIELCIMNAHPAIRQGCVVAFSVEEQEQEKLIIAAELKSSAHDNAMQAADAITQTLADQHNLAPKAVLLVRSGTLPKTSSGKLQRYRAREQYLANELKQIHTLTAEQHAGADISLVSAEFQMAADDLDKDTYNGEVVATRLWLQRLLAVSLRVKPEEISCDLEFSMFGIDSAQALAMTSRISKFVGHEITPSVLYEYQTINRLAFFICSPEGSRHKSLVRLQKGDTRIFPKLFCVHPVGGSAMAYLGLVDKLVDEIPVYAFSNEGDSVPDDDLVAMAKHYVTEMQAEQSEGPYYLMGYSFGGTVAFEMACQVLANGGEIGGLFLVDSPAPLYNGEAKVQRLSQQDGYSGFFDSAIVNQLIPDQLSDAEREKMQLRIDKNHRALAEYRIDAGAVRPQLRMLRASAEAPDLREAIQHPAFDQPDFGWNKASPDAVIEVAHMPGDHFSIMNAPQALAEKLSVWLSCTISPVAQSHESHATTTDLPVH